MLFSLQPTYPLSLVCLEGLPALGANLGHALRTTGLSSALSCIAKPWTYLWSARRARADLKSRVMLSIRWST